MKQTDIDSLNDNLFEAIEMLKNNTDPNASANEKIDIQTAKAIADLSKIVIEGYKVKAQVLSILSRSENPKLTNSVAAEGGIFREQKQLLIN